MVVTPMTFDHKYTTIRESGSLNVSKHFYFQAFWTRDAQLLRASLHVCAVQ